MEWWLHIKVTSFKKKKLWSNKYFPSRGVLTKTKKTQKKRLQPLRRHVRTIEKPGIEGSRGSLEHPQQHWTTTHLANISSKPLIREPWIYLQGAHSVFLLPGPVEPILPLNQLLIQVAILWLPKYLHSIVYYLINCLQSVSVNHLSSHLNVPLQSIPQSACQVSVPPISQPIIQVPAPYIPQPTSYLPSQCNTPVNSIAEDFLMDEFHKAMPTSAS